MEIYVIFKIMPDVMIHVVYKGLGNHDKASEMASCRGREITYWKILESFYQLKFIIDIAEY